MTAEIVLPVESLDAGDFAEFGVVFGDGPSSAPETSNPAEAEVTPTTDTIRTEN